MSPARSSDTRQQILDRAWELLRTRGMDGFSYRDISTHLGVRNAAIHYHFPSKSDLGAALLDQFETELRDEIRQGREQAMAPRAQLEVYFDRSLCECDQEARMCPFGALSASYDQLAETMRERVVRLRELVHGWMVETLAAGRDRGEFRFEGEPAAKALQIAAAIQGARQLARMTTPDAVQCVVDQFRQELYTDQAARTH